MIEPEAAFFELPDNMALAERFIKRLLGDVLSHCSEDMAFFEERVQQARSLLCSTFWKSHLST